MYYIYRENRNGPYGIRYTYPIRTRGRRRVVHC